MRQWINVLLIIMYCFTGTSFGEWRRNGRNWYCCKKWSHFYSCRSSYPTHHCSNSASSVWWDKKSNCNGKKNQKSTIAVTTPCNTHKKGGNRYISEIQPPGEQCNTDNLQRGHNTVLYFSEWDLVHPIQFGNKVQAFTFDNTQVLFLVRSLSIRLIL